MPYLKIILLACSLFAMPSITLALTIAECRTISSNYNFTPEQCLTQITNQGGLVQGRLSLEQIEGNIFFPGGGYQLDTAATQQLQLLAIVLETTVLKGACIQFIGHSSSDGTASNNQALGLKRAQTVAFSLGGMLEDAYRIENITSSGEDHLLENFPAAHRLQRRVSIMLRDCP